MTENDRGGKEMKEISKKVTCSYMVSDLAYSAGACVEQLHLFSSSSPFLYDDTTYVQDVLF